MSLVFAHLQTVSHEGKVVVLAMDSSGVLHYTIRQSGFEDTVLKGANDLSDVRMQGFEPWQALLLDQSQDDPSVATYEQNNFTDAKGQQLIQSQYDEVAARSRVAQVQMLSAMGHLYLFRVSTKGYLLMNRFVLDGMNNTLIPKLEVRYRRSGQKLVPEKSGSVSQDALDFRDIDDNVFYEPALGLNFLGKFSRTTPWFSVQLLNTNEHEKYRWSFFVYTDKALKLVSVAAGPDGRVMLQDQVKIQPDPEASDKKILTRIPGIVSRQLQLDGELAAAFSACQYNNQMERQTKAGPQLMKDATRVMLSAPIRNGQGETQVAAISFAVNNQGMLSQIDTLVDQSEILRADIKNLLLPLNTLDEIKLIADQSPTPQGSIAKIAQGDEELVSITSIESIEDMTVGKTVKISGTQSYNGCYVAKNITDTSFDIAAVFGDEEDSQGYWEVVEEDNLGLVFENMIASYERTDTGALRISCPAHNLMEGDEIKITGSVNQDGSYPVRDKADDNSFLIDEVFPVGEVVNLSRVKRRGLYFDGQGDYLQTQAAVLPSHKANNDLARSFACWVYLDAISGQPQSILQSQGEQSWHLFVDKNGQLSFNLQFADGSQASVQDPEVLPLKSWVHITAMAEYFGEDDGHTEMALARAGVVVAEQRVEPAKPVHLPAHNLSLTGQHLAIEKLHYNQAEQIPELTVEAWVCTSQQGYGVVASFDRNEYWRLGLHIVDGKRVVQWCTRASRTDDMNGQVEIPDNTWTHIAVTYNASSSEKAIYVNGQLDSQKKVHANKALGTGATRYGFIGVGSEADKVGSAFNDDTQYQGLLADLRIWNKEHNVDAINQYRLMALTGLEANLVANWSLAQTDAKKLPDNSRSKAHARKVGMVAWQLAAHRVPGSAAQLEGEQYSQSFSMASALSKGKPVNEFKGKLSELQIWQIALDKTQLKTQIYNQLSGSEYGLVGYWKLGGIAHNEAGGRISPDFSVNEVDANVYDETYVSACDLSRANSLGKAVIYENDELVAVSQGAVYRESLEFRAMTEDGECWTLDQVQNAGRPGKPIFKFAYWGKKSRSSENKTDIAGVMMEDFVDAGDGWFKAKATFTIPEGVNLIRSFGLSDVSGQWQDELEAPEEEWQTLQIRKHQIELISNSISRDHYTDELDLSVLADGATSLKQAIRDIPRQELDVAEKRKQLNLVLEELDLYNNVTKFEREHDNLVKSTNKLAAELKTLRSQKEGFSKNPLNYRIVWRAVEAGRVLDMSNKRDGSQVYIYGQHNGGNQVWEFIRQSDGNYKIKSVANGLYLSASSQGKNTFIQKKNSNNQLWTVSKRKGSQYSIHNVATGMVLDVYGHGRKDKSRVVLWPYNGQNNQMWQLIPYSKVWRLQREYESQKRKLGGLIGKMFAKVLKPIEDGINAIRKKFPMGEPKSTYQDEYKGIERAYKQTDSTLKSQNARLARLKVLLANRSPARLQQLQSFKDSLIESISSAEQQLANLNTHFIQLAGELQNEAQSMELVAQDKQGLNSYGAILGFANPAGDVQATASAEGNVQLSYFDQQGCMRTTQYDACSDSVNTSFEQWLPESVQSCADFRQKDSLASFKESPLDLGASGYTVESWFYYPPSFDAAGKPYPLNCLTSDASSQESVIAIFDNRRLGTLVDGFFHDSGWDMAQNLAQGWHHVAAVARNGASEFYVDGEAVGLDADQQRETPRQAMNFNGSNQYLSLAEETLDLSSGMTVMCWVKYKAFNHWSRIIDFGNGPNSNNIVFANQAKTGNLAINVRQGDQRKGLVAEGVLRKGEWQHIAATIDSTGTATLYVNGKEVAYGDCQLPLKIKRSKNYIGRSNWSSDKYFSGQLSDLCLFNTALGQNQIDDSMFGDLTGEEANLVHYWSMKSKDVNGKLVAFDSVENGARHGQLNRSPSSQVLDKQCSQAVTSMGNLAKKGAPMGRLSELRLWHAPLSVEEVRVNSRIRLTGNEPDLAYYYKLDDATGNSMRDFCGQANGQYQQTQAVACTAPIGNPGRQVLEFDGEGDLLSLPGVDIRKRSFTVEFWCKRSELERADWLIFQGASKKNQGLHIGFRDKDTYAFAFYSNDLNVDAKLANHQWMHFAQVYDARAKTQHIYLNGKLWRSRNKVAAYTGKGDLLIGRRPGKSYFKGQLAELRIWREARSAAEVAEYWQRSANPGDRNLMYYLPMDSLEAARGRDPKVTGVKQVLSNDLPLIQGQALVTAEYQTMEIDPADSTQQRAMLRRFYAFAQDGGLRLLPGKRIEQLVLKWVGNAQFEPTLLGYIEGAPPVPSENLTVNYDYDGATSIELIQSEDTTYSWNRSKDFSQGLDLNMFLGVGWGAEGGFGVVSKISEGKAGFRGMLNMRDGQSSNSNIRAQSTNMLSDRLELRGSYETEPKFAYLGNRYVPKNVGYALVVSGLADLYITQMQRSGRMIGYQVQPVKDVPLDINTITFMINPAYSMNGSLDGLVGTHAADERFYAQVPQMRAQYGSLYPAGYYNLSQAYDIKAQIDRWDKERESYFINYDATQTTEAALNNQTADADEYDSYGGVEVDNEQTEGEEEKSEQEVREETKSSYSSMKKSGKKEAEQRKAQIQAQIGDQNKQVEANAAFESWQKRMENLQIRAAKRNIVNTYVWDADGGMRSEEQSFANTVEHTVGGSFSLSGSAGGDTDVMVTGFKFELQALYAAEMTQTMSKTLTTSTGLDLNVRLDGVERKGVTDENDYPILPGEKVDRYRFMSFYLEGSTDHFNDFFSQVVDPEWLMSNDEEARALRQVESGRANKCWRVMHRVTYVERPALMGFGQDLRSESGAEAAATEVFNYFDALEQANDALRADLSELKSQITSLTNKIDQMDKEESDG